MLTKLALCILVLQLSACSVVKRQYDFIEPVKKFSPKDYHQVLTTMGAPSSVAVLNDSFIFAYHSVTIKEPQFGLTIPYYDLFKFNLGSATAKHNYHFYAFNFDGTSINLSQLSWQNQLGDGTSIGLIFVVEETVDLSNFDTPKETSLWGKNLLIDKDLAELNFQEVILGKRLDLIGQSF